MKPSQRDLAAISTTLLASLVAHADEERHLPSEVYVFQDMPVHHSKTLEFRSVVSGTTVDGCKIAVHETSLAPQSEPRPPHHHNGEEIFLMLEGILEVTINGQSSRISRGSVAFIGSGDQHGIRDPGEIPARYYVFELSPQR